MKPRLTKRQGYWWCKGRNRSGIAKNPVTAYMNWKRQIENKHDTQATVNRNT